MSKNNKAVYEVYTVQNGVPEWTDEDTEDTPASFIDEVIEIKHGSFEGLQDAVDFKECLEQKIAEANSYLVTAFTPTVEIRAIHTEAIRIDAYNAELEEVIHELRQADKDVQKALIDGLKANLKLYNIIKEKQG